jgi:hypothetical protein
MMVKQGSATEGSNSFVCTSRQVRLGVEPRLLMLSDQFRHFSMTKLRIASVQVSADHFARIVFPEVSARG